MALTARLMYKAADKAMGVEKTKQQAKEQREREKHMQTARESETSVGRRTDRG